MTKQNTPGTGGVQTPCDSKSCGCDSGLSRREFVSILTAAAVGVAGMRSKVVAGPFSAPDFDKLVPADKKLSPEWIKSLFDRGTPRVYRGDELKYIGMPVGGLTTGQLYVGGDGRLWHWDIFNQNIRTNQAHYANPVDPVSPLEQGFSLTIDTGGKKSVRALDVKGFPEVTFTGQYPIATVEYRDAGCPLVVTLEAFSPFIPLNVADSSFPATVLHFTVKNTGDQPVEAELAGHLQNAVALYSGARANGKRRNQITREDHELLLLQCTAGEAPGSGEPSRATIVFEDFEGEDYGKWTVEGTAFGKGPAKGAPAAGQRLTDFLGKSLANSWSGSDVPRGKLTSPSFTIERNRINFLIGGGKHPAQTCINLLVDGKVVRTETGKDSDAMEWVSWDVRNLAGKTSRIEIVDQGSGGWGHIEIDEIEFADAPRGAKALAEQTDFGSMALGLLNAAEADFGRAGVSIDDTGAIDEAKTDSAALDERLIGALARKLSLKPGESQTATFVLTWYFPNLEMRGIKGPVGRHYATRFKSAGDVAQYITANFESLSSQTRLWRDTYYDSTLPHWFLDRTHLNASTLATSTAHRFTDGRFYGWEGVGCCKGTCTHVWHYEHAMGRLFPELDILLRERADFNPEIGMNANGMIDHRGEFHAGEAVDGQAGVILRAYRDHQMSSDNAFLKRNYASIKKAMQWLIAQDGLDGADDGILQGAQHNTLDAEWYGPVAWLSGLYLASLRAAEQMACEAGDSGFADQCRDIFKTGQKKFVATLFDGEYFINKPDPKHPEAINSGTGCEIDQVFGQSWAFQVGLGRVLPEKETRSALTSLWKYNFTPDAGAYRKVNRPGRWYAMEGEAGMLMCTFPRTDWNYKKAGGQGTEGFTGYFNECMNGFEHQVAGHMIWEGMVQDGLAVERAIHDRYDASKRNPWNEVECGDHYARSMASYGVFIAACGYEYHGPKGYLAFAPRISWENFKAAFTAAEGWGTFWQKSVGGKFSAGIEIKAGQLKLKTLCLASASGTNATRVNVTLDGNPVPARFQMADDRPTVNFEQGATIGAGRKLELELS